MRRSRRLRYNALEAAFAGVLPNELAAADLMTVKLQAEDIGHDRL